MRIRPFLLGVAATIAAGALGAGLFVVSGIYSVAATSAHTQPVYDLVSLALRRSIGLHSGGVQPPDGLFDGPPTRGLAAYHTHCAQCHGAPGVAPRPFALGMNPVPMNLHVSVSRETPGELFWAIKNGIKMTGMPAWDYRLSDDEIWDVTAFLLRMPGLAPAEYRERLAEVGLEPRPIRPEPTVPRPSAAGASMLGDAEAGRRAIAQYGCAMCHRVPEVTGREVHVGPSLAGAGDRRYIAGVLANTPRNMVRWLMNPPAVDPLTAMPDLGVTEADARDMAAFLLERGTGR